MDGRAVGLRKARAAVHANGDWHAAIHVWVVTTAYGDPRVVLQRRSATKDTWPGRLDVAVGGHMRAGESLAETLREAEEELGLTLAVDDVTELGHRFVSTVTGTGLDDREVQSVLGVVVERTLISLRLHPDEVDAVVCLRLTDARTLLVDGLPVEALERRRDETVERAVTVARADVLPDRDGYYTLALAALYTLVAGQPVAPFLLRQ